MKPALRAILDEISATILRILAYIGAIAVIVVTVFRLFGSPTVEAAIGPATRSDWTTVERPYRAFSLTVATFSDPEPDYAIRRHRAGGRKDIMTWGAPWDDSSMESRLMIEIYRPGSENARFDDAAGEVVASTAALGGPYALKAGATLESKFGRIATYDFTARAAGRLRACLGFVRTFNDPRLQIAGWYCRGRMEVIDRAAFECTLDRLSLVMAASEPKVKDLFAKAELKRRPCAPKATTRVASTKRGDAQRSDWLDTANDPKLRGRVAGK